MAIADLLWFGGGIVAGVFQSWMIGRSVYGDRASKVASGMVRYLVAAAYLTTAAVLGHILAAAAGWAVGFAVSSIRIALSHSRRRERNAT